MSITKDRLSYLLEWHGRRLPTAQSMGDRSATNGEITELIRMAAATPSPAVSEERIRDAIKAYDRVVTELDHWDGTANETAMRAALLAALGEG